MKNHQKADGNLPPGKPTKKTVPEPPQSKAKPVEVGGPKGPEPTRYGDWECKGRCSDF